MIGPTLSHYEILERLGSGGMGEVYKARDVRLDRAVALKILPERFADSEEKRARFHREARVVSQLNHPRICTLYDVGFESDVDYLVMEYLEGVTLAERLEKGALPFAQALEYGGQIAEGLEHAHRAGIVHRDLKPANVLLTSSGVKLLDFGLAKLTAASPPSDDAEAPTAERDLTKEQTIVGTLPYMAPEQLEGKNVDHRTDLWALGAVLYEMVTGRRAFEGESQARLVAAILGGMGEAKTVEPPLLNELIHRCLSIRPEERWASANDVKHVLSWLAGSNPDAIRARPRPLGVVVGALLAGLVLGGLASVALRNSQAPPRPRMELSIPLPATDDLARTPDLAVSPDGSFLVYNGTRDGVSRLFLRSLDQSEVQAIPGTESASGPFFSPDGKSLGFFSRGALRKVSMDSGAPVTLAEGQVSSEGTWGPDGSIIYVENRRELRAVSAGGGASVSISLQVPDGTVYQAPQFLPGGKALVFTLGQYSGGERIAVGSLESGKVQVLAEGRRPRFSPTGHLLFFRDATIWAVRFDPRRLETRGSPFPIVSGVLDVFSATFDVSGDGALFYVPETRERALVWVDRRGRSTLLTSTKDQYASPRLSPDGARVAVETSLKDVWVVDVERGSRTRLTLESTASMNTVPSWTRDGARVTFSAVNDATGSVYSAPFDGSEAPRPILTLERWPIPGSWSPDGKTLAFHDLPAGGNRDILVFTPESGEPPQPFLATSFNERSPAFSPDGRWLAYISDESGRDEIYVRAYPGPGPKTPVSTDGGVQPVWSPAGGELFYRLGESMMVVDVQTHGDRFLSTRPRVLFQGRYLMGNPNNPNYSVSPDGQRFVMVQDSPASSHVIAVVLNWQGALGEN